MDARTEQGRVGALVAAVEEVAAAGELAVASRFDLLRTQLMEEARTALVAAGILGAGTSTVALGWILLMAALVAWLYDRVGPIAAPLVVGLPHLVLGVGVAAWALRQYRWLPEGADGA